MLNVRITSKKTQQVVATVPIVLGGLNYQPNEKEAFDLAWNTAVDDGLVEANRRADYDFEAVGAPG